MFCESNNRLTTYCDDRVYQTYAIEYEIQEISQRFDRLQQWLENKNEQDPSDNEKDLYFDCVEQFEDDYDLIEQQECDNRVDYQCTTTNSSDQSCNNISNICDPWIFEICLSIHRKTSPFRRFLNYFNRSRKQSLPNLAKEFVRIHAGRFNHPVGYRFHMSYAKEKWLLILKNLQLINYPKYPNPQTRITFIRKGVLYIASLIANIIQIIKLHRYEQLNEF